MHFAYSESEEAFRLQLRSWLADALPPGWGETVFEPEDEEERYLFRRDWDRKLGTAAARDGDGGRRHVAVPTEGGIDDGDESTAGRIGRGRVVVIGDGDEGCFELPWAVEICAVVRHAALVGGACPKIREPNGDGCGKHARLR